MKQLVIINEELKFLSSISTTSVLFSIQIENAIKVSAPEGVLPSDMFPQTGLKGCTFVELSRYTVIKLSLAFDYLLFLIKEAKNDEKAASYYSDILDAEVKKTDSGWAIENDPNNSLSLESLGDILKYSRYSSSFIVNTIYEITDSDIITATDYSRFTVKMTDSYHKFMKSIDAT
jgi:hypothetical protein